MHHQQQQITAPLSPLANLSQSRILPSDVDQSHVMHIDEAMADGNNDNNNRNDDNDMVCMEYDSLLFISRLFLQLR